MAEKTETKNALKHSYSTTKIVLTDATGNGKPDIEVSVDTAMGTLADYVDIGFKDNDCRILVENDHGNLTLYVWATDESVQSGKPTHKIVIEPEKPEVEK